MKSRFKIKEVLKKLYYNLFLTSFQKELNKLKGKVTSGEILIIGNIFSYHHGHAFYDTYNELFVKNIYKFKNINSDPVIIDCGANMGLSVLYFAKEYPQSKIIAFEPDESVLPFLKQNISNYNLTNVLLYEKAVWSSNTNLSFYTDKGMGGRLEFSYLSDSPKTVKTFRLRDVLDRQIDFLKLDIEGAEMEVLYDCIDKLDLVSNIFIEYHSSKDKEQELGELLMLLKRKEFRYHLSQSFSRNRPYIDNDVVCEKFDMAINIFAYKDLNKDGFCE